MKKLIIAILTASGATVVYAHAETADGRNDGASFRSEMRALTEGDGMDVAALANMMLERSQARFDALDADGDGILSREEFDDATEERTQAMFERMGPDEDGVVTRSRGERGFGRHQRGGPRGMDSEERAERMSERAAERFAALDTDEDGMLSPQEFEAGMQSMAGRMERRGMRGGGPRHGMMRGMRGDMPEEMRQMHAQLRSMMREGMTLEGLSGLMEGRATARFETLDGDGDGEVTREEFSAAVGERAERMFARMDRNEDGVVTGDDRPRWKGRGHGGPRGGKD